MFPLSFLLVMKRLQIAQSAALSPILPKEQRKERPSRNSPMKTNLFLKLSICLTWKLKWLFVHAVKVLCDIKGLLIKSRIILFCLSSDVVKVVVFVHCFYVF